jgi:hypothetical protein
MVTDLMPITGTTDNDIVLIIEIIVKDQLAKDTIIIVMQKIIIEGRIIAGILKTVGIQMTTDMPEIIKVKENMQTKETMAKIIMENINSNYETGKKRERNNCALFFFRNLSFS